MDEKKKEKAITSNYLEDETCDKLKYLLNRVNRAGAAFNLDPEVTQAEFRELFKIIDEGIEVLCNDCVRGDEDREPSASEEARHYGEHRG